MIGKPHTAEDNCLHIPDLDVPIYRVFSAKRFQETFRKRQLTLVRPNLWDDPFENFLYQVRCVSADAGDPVSIEGLSRRLYGQCWSFLSESDAMWRIYAPRKNGVLVRTTVRKLINAVYDPSDGFAALKYFIGRVQYSDEATLLNFFSDPERVLACITHTSGRAPVELLLWKRGEFEHEKEVRLIFQRADDVADNIAAFSINPFTLFDEIVFDPRIEVPAFEKAAAKLKGQGFSGPIRRSTLYQLPIIPGKIPI